MEKKKQYYFNDFGVAFDITDGWQNMRQIPPSEFSQHEQLSRPGKRYDESGVSGMSDRDFLLWLHERLEHVHHEHPDAAHMHKLRAIIKT